MFGPVLAAMSFRDEDHAVELANATHVGLVAGDTVLAGPDLTLRPLGPQDVDAVVAACADPQTQRWTSVPQPYERRHAQDFIEVAAPRALVTTRHPFGARGDGAGRRGRVATGGPAGRLTGCAPIGSSPCCSCCRPGGG